MIFRRQPHRAPRSHALRLLPSYPRNHSSLATAFAFFAPCYPACFHTNTNCPICNSFVLITIRIAGGVGGPPYLGVKASIPRRMRVLSEAKDLSGDSSDCLGLSTVSWRLL